MLEHERWFEFSRNDLKDAECLLKAESFLSATYHCQQAAEKALKAYLVFKEHEIVKTHNLVMLGGLCKMFDQNFQRINRELELLNPFATKFRYPSEFDLPDKEETKFVIMQAKSVVNFVLKKISIPIAGQMEI
jgi:HEPN domain-containing protein